MQGEWIVGVFVGVYKIFLKDASRNQVGVCMCKETSAINVYLYI